MQTVEKELPAIAAQQMAVTPMQVLSAAVAKGIDTAQLAQLMELQERWEKNEARKAYVAAMTEFKRNPPVLTKNKHVKFTTQKGVTEYDHATLDQVSDTIGAALSEHGITHRWDVEPMDGGAVKVSCVLTHAQGHSERVSLQAGADASGGKNSIQGVGSTITYLQRYTLLAVSGLAVKDQDDDGNGGETGMPETIKADFIAAIEALDSLDAADDLWQKISAATREYKDVDANDQLRAAMAAKRRGLK